MHISSILDINTFLRDPSNSLGVPVLACTEIQKIFSRRMSEEEEEERNTACTYHPSLCLSLKNLRALSPFEGSNCADTCCSFFFLPFFFPRVFSLSFFSLKRKPFASNIFQFLPNLSPGSSLPEIPTTTTSSCSSSSSASYPKRHRPLYTLRYLHAA